MLGGPKNQFSLTLAGLSTHGAQEAKKQILISLCMSGNTDFWHNDLFIPTFHPRSGNNLFGANRSPTIKYTSALTPPALFPRLRPDILLQVSRYSHASARRERSC